MIISLPQMRVVTSRVTKTAMTPAMKTNKRRKDVRSYEYSWLASFLSLNHLATFTQREAETDNAPGPSRPKRKRAPTPPPAFSKTGPRKRRRGAKRDTEYGVARGIDFLDVACVLNFDLPTSSRAYTHRVGRTARAGRGGTALSFVLPSSEFGKHKAVGSVPSTRCDEEVWERIARTQQGRVREYLFDKKQVDGFRYRMEDALRAVTRHAIREARLKEIKQELLTSDKLKVRHTAHPRRDLSHLLCMPTNGGGNGGNCRLTLKTTRTTLNT
jgi:ATP-dependent RNA helicase DDX56/DBP9